MSAGAVLTSPGLVDVVMVFAALEGVCLILWRRRPVMDVVLLLLPGVFLMVALRAALAGAAWPWVPFALIGSLCVHVADMRYRWRGV